MRQLCIFLSSLLLVVNLNADSYNKVECKVGNDRITMPVPSQYRVVSRDEVWATEYFRQVENVMKDYNRNRTVKIGMITRERYDFFNINSQLMLDGFDCEVQCLNSTEWSRSTYADFFKATDGAEAVIIKALSDANSVAKDVNDSSLSKSGVNRLKSFKDKDFKVISKSDRHFIFGIALVPERYTKIASMTLVNGKILILYLGKPDTETLAAVAEMTSWVEEIEKTTSAETPTDYFPYIMTGIKILFIFVGIGIGISLSRRLNKNSTKENTPKS